MLMGILKPVCGTSEKAPNDEKNTGNRSKRFHWIQCNIALDQARSELDNSCS